MSVTTAAQMTSADLLKLRKRRSTVIWTLVLMLGPLLIYFIVKAAQHSSNSARYGPAGGVRGFDDTVRLLALFFGPLAAILIGVEGGAGDAASGVFRDLVATGRSRVALFASRVPAALALSLLVTAVSYAVLAIGTYALASGSPTPDATLMLSGFGFSLLAIAVVCAVAVGFGALTTSRPAALTVLIGWQLVASPILVNIGSLGNVRKLILTQAIAHFSPVEVGQGRHAPAVAMSQGTAVGVLAVWLAIFLALGAWRTRTMDA
jgi:ABC-type transport system involved in multi-copper enzyme maturation permease subunit